TPPTTETVTWRYHRTSLSSKRTKPMLTYHQITAAERYVLGLLRQRGLTAAAIARVLCRHRSTIGREVRRNGTPRDGCYRPQLASKRPITTRPRAAETRAEIGHWEADTVLGAGQAGACVLSMVERKTGYLLLGQLRQRTSAAVNHRAHQLIAAQPHPVQTITVDNGTEFHDYARLEQATATRFYFATPHHAW